MNRRPFLKLTSAIAIAAALTGTAAAADTIRIGAVAPRTGPLAGGATVTQWPSIELWVHQVNEAGGLNVDGEMMLIELIEYDDQTNPGETIRAVQRLATQDNAHFIIAPYGTGLNLAAAPLFDRYGYPQIAVSAITDQQGALAEQFPNMFFTLGTTTALASDLVDVLEGMRDAGDLGNRVAMVNVADAFGIELATAARPLFEEAGFEIVYDTSYPLGTQDLSPVINGAAAAEPDAFVAWSYPPDTFGLTEQAMIAGLDVDAFYTAVATPFPGYGARFGPAAEGVLGAGGVNPDSEAFQAYAAAHLEVTGAEPDYWASATTYASLEILAQSIEAVGLDRAEVSDYLREATFETILGPISFDENNSNAAFWTVGQWQGGVFRGVASRDRDGAVPVILKDGWE
ncbi:amino acid ABC transporter substrate-binding protein [Rhodobacteraceae bacterium N5(2021)]|uniref:Amino acid ABC transporter substrate-binding protein n=1 Tax=Gymnodinialimonas phycosphaerae TaxID=2841589 RepID=A0A975TVQ3_9RHOB|nr:amino acid ABC transporter substrate-binding protein [Gymnodinialimonas phycosphaerae]MBY4891815.1 amino acid ABC transporter substrate-binding protein [Gymnodinialimonas phycosphaerae]